MKTGTRFFMHKGNLSTKNLRKHTQTSTTK